jgi:hypothetical protein
MPAALRLQAVEKSHPQLASTITHFPTHRKLESIARKNEN